MPTTTGVDLGRGLIVGTLAGGDGVLAFAVAGLGLDVGLGLGLTGVGAAAVFASVATVGEPKVITPF